MVFTSQKNHDSNVKISQILSFIF